MYYSSMEFNFSNNSYDAYIMKDLHDEGLLRQVIH
jgi:hypothetical protein